MSEADPIDALREALKVSPDNVPLRRHLAQSLLGMEQYEEAQEEFKKALQFAPDDVEAKLGLAQTYSRQGKLSAAAVVLEDVLARPGAPAKAYIDYTWLLVREGEIAKAVEQYRKAISLDPSVKDDALSERLGVQAEGLTPEEAMVVDGRVRAADGMPEEAMDLPLEDPKMNFSDVGGMDAVKEEIRMKIIHPLTNRDLYEAYGKSIGGGILLYGPPGCGKTHLAKATAGEINAGFMAVGLHDVLDMWIGQSEQRLHAIFEQARRQAPCVLFFDEVDALGASRSDLRHSAGRNLINQFLSELDGMQADNEGVLILAATNAPWHLDTAFRRPGRFDRIIFVPPPDEPARASITEILLKGKPQKDLDLKKVAKKTDGFSGADLKGLVDAAIEFKLREALKLGVPEPIQTRDLVAACKKQKATTQDWFATAKNYALYSNESGLYDDILEHLKLK